MVMVVNCDATAGVIAVSDVAIIKAVVIKALIIVVFVASLV